MWKQQLAFVVLLVVVDCSASSLRVKRQFFAPSEECVISSSEIDELVRLTKLIEGRRSSRKRPVSREPTVTNASDECSRKLREFKASIEAVLSRYSTMQKSYISANQYELLKAQQESELTDLLRRVDNFEREVEQRFLAEIERLRNSLQKLKRRLNDNLRLLEQERAAGRRAQEALCVGYIQGDKVEEAAKIYRALNGTYDIVRLTNDTYELDGNSVGALVGFFEAIQDDAQQFRTISGYEALHAHLERNNQLDRERSRIIFHSLVGLEHFYTNPVDIARVQELRVKMIDKLQSFVGKTK
ncbi:uncharacterized protein LOC126565139 [Anopheles maculipalpis]|uniref:uncharacterized protein LOC126565139 n=1 Tax=Anopheles maculipalpis TaxID=1496333 RepID=UPI002158CD42|nr:uncharacterized protein LOC126565139 [Anopheles maculipalpis]